MKGRFGPAVRSPRVERLLPPFAARKLSNASERGDTVDNVWTAASAKTRFSTVIERAQSGPQTITRNGKPSAVIVSDEEWARKTARKGTLAEFLLASPLAAGELDFERQRDQPRNVEFRC